MAKFPSMPLMTDAYIADTQHLSNEEHGCYLRMLMIAWRTPECALPDDDKRIATMLGLTLKRWREKIKPVVQPFWTVDNGQWTQKKQLEVRKKVEKNVQQKRDAYEQTERAKRLKQKENGLSDDPSDDLSPEEPTKTKTKESTGKGLKGRSLSPGAHDPPPTQPDPKKFLMTAEWAMPSDLHDELTAEHVPRLGIDPFWRQIQRFRDRHAALGTEDTETGFAELLRGWLERADANRDTSAPPAANGVSAPSNGGDPPTAADLDQFVGKAIWLAERWIKDRQGAQRISGLELVELKGLARRICRGDEIQFGLSRIGFWSAADLRNRVAGLGPPQPATAKAAAG